MDEDRDLCRNQYGSNEVIDLDEKRGTEASRKLDTKYNLSIGENPEFCGKVCVNAFRLRNINQETFKALDQTQILDACKCKRVYMVYCKNQTEIPEKFPKDVRSRKFYLEH